MAMDVPTSLSASLRIQHTGPTSVSTYFRIRLMSSIQRQPNGAQHCYRQHRGYFVGRKGESLSVHKCGSSISRPCHHSGSRGGRGNCECESTSITRATVWPYTTSLGVHKTIHLLFSRSYRARRGSHTTERLRRPRPAWGCEWPVPHPSAARNIKHGPARRSHRKPTEEEELDESDETSPEDEDGRPVRVLKLTARFDSFVLWHRYTCR
jgi:hypothetical protein